MSRRTSCTRAAARKAIEQSRITRSLLFLFHDPDVPELEGVAVALELDRAGGPLGVAAVAARRSSDLLVLVDDDAVVLHGDEGVLRLLRVRREGVRELDVVGLPGEGR